MLIENKDEQRINNAAFELWVIWREDFINDAIDLHQQA